MLRICIDSREKSSEARILEKRFKAAIDVSRVYSILGEFTEDEIDKIASSLHNPVVETARINKPYKKRFDYALELGFLPGVTDNVAATAAEIMNDLLKRDIGRNKVFTSKVLFISGGQSLDDVKNIAGQLINTLIERYHIKTFTQYTKDNGMDKIIPEVKLKPSPEAMEIDLELADDELIELGKKGIIGPDGKRRGPLALDLDYLHAIRDYFRKQKRKPTDIELESIAQTWSEHCKHTIFASPIDDIKEGIFARFIKGATQRIRKNLGKNDFCVSVFKDNSGAIGFDDDFLITDKVETHNSPSALDPFGGAITGIVGVNRDTIGFGLGAKPIANKYGYCVGYPEDDELIYRSKDNPALPPRRILDGIVQGVNAGGNCSGIPTPSGFLFFDSHYKGKPLVFVGTVGLIPKEKDGRKLHEKSAMPGDNIVVIGGRVGKDGIHGATFSSEAMSIGSPATAVQIGDPITQKKLSDAIVKEARDLELYTSITDNGAGGISCSVAEMAKECGGFAVDLEKVPLKYPGLEPWETWISESQERMTLAVPDAKLKDFTGLMKDRGVETAVIGRFNDSGIGIVTHKGKEIFNLSMDFLHDGLPEKKLFTRPYAYSTHEQVLAIDDQHALFERMLSSHNICSFEWISKQYDHEVQNNSVIKPLQGKGRVNNSAFVIRPVPGSKRGIVLSQGLYPRLSEVSCYDMAAAGIDTAIRNAVAVGADPARIALLDNFCWCSSNEPERLGQLKDAAQGCYDYAVAFKTPFISGKDSMFNDFKGQDAKGRPVKISVHPTLLISSIGVIDDVTKTCTIDFKVSGDLIYVIGETRDECAGSEFYHINGMIGANSPKVDAASALRSYKKIHELIKNGTLSSCISIEKGGLLIALAKMAISGKLGAEVDFEGIADGLSFEKKCYSESQSRLIITIDPASEQEFRKAAKGLSAAFIGKVRDGRFTVKDAGSIVFDYDVDKLERIYKQRFADY